MANNPNPVEIARQNLFKYMELGLNPIPLKWKEKKPLIRWKEYQERKVTKEEIEGWLKEFEQLNVGIVTGSISGNLVVIDFDTMEAIHKFWKKLAEEDSELKEKLEKTWRVKTGKGLHIYLRVDCPADEFKEKFRTKPRLVDGVDIKAEGGYVVAPPSIHPSGAEYTFLSGPDTEIVTITMDEWQTILSVLQGGNKLGLGVSEENEKNGTTNTTEKHNEKSSAFNGECRKLTNREIGKIVDRLETAYKPGYRNYIILFLTGWMRKARICYESAREVIERLAAEDEEISQRIYVLDRTYELAGNPPSPDELKGVSGLQEILEKVLGEEQALDIIRELEEIFGVASPYKDSVIGIMSYRNKIFAVANLRKLLVVRAQKVKDGLEYLDKVLTVAPTMITVYSNPLGGVKKYEMVFEGRAFSRPITVGPATFPEIVGRLEAEGVVTARRHVKDVLAALIEAYLLKGLAKEVTEMESPGFYRVDGKIINVRWKIDKIPKDKLRKAVELLDELATQWFSHIPSKFATIIKWGIIAPFIFAIKQKGRWVPWLYLYGEAATGKTTLGEIILNIWGLNSWYNKTGSTIDTVPRLGHVISYSTFPTLINEPGGAISKDDVVETLKGAISGTTARGKYLQGTFIEFPALSPFIFTSNKMLPKDSALTRRFIIIPFSYGEKIDKKTAKIFESAIRPRFKDLRYIGYWVAKRVMKDPSILDMEWDKAAEKLLIDLHYELMLTPPDWITKLYTLETDEGDEKRERIRQFLVRALNDAYAKLFGKITAKDGEEESFEHRAQKVLYHNGIDWCFLRNGTVYFTTGFANALKTETGETTLKSIAELLGWEYKLVKIGGKPKRAVAVPFDELMKFLVELAD